MKKVFFPAILLFFCVAGSLEAASVRLAWDPSGDPKVVGYKVHYGTRTRNYTKTLDVKGKHQTTATVSDLEDGKDYFFALTSYHADGKESAYSEELSTGPEQAPARITQGDAPAAGPDAPAPPAGPAVTAPVVKDTRIPPREGLDRTQGKIAPSRRLPDSSRSTTPLEPWEDPRIPPSKRF